MSELDPVEPVDDCDDLVNTIGALLTSLTDALATLASAKTSAATDVAALNAQINALWQQQVALNQQISVTPLGPARDLLVAQANALEAQRNTLLARRDCKQYLVDGADIVTSIVDTTIAQYNTLDANSGGPCTPERREILQQMIDLLFHALTITVNQIENIAAGCP
jgi:capsule polysaccharide export protein KpsE/RkpR